MPCIFLPNPRMNQHKRYNTSMLENRNRGFTMIELVVTIAFMGIVIVSLMELFTVLRQTNRAADNYTIATQVAQQLVEQYRNTPYANIALGTVDLTSSALGSYPSLQTPRSAIVTVTETDPDGLKKLEVAVSYKGRTGTRSVQLTTYVSYRGINK
jgi:prepilin-type N-terminal cleavage/methylation domain-containing protein